MFRFDVLLFWEYIVTVNIHDNDVLCGYHAVKALDEYISNLEKRKTDGLTEKQLNVLIKAAQILRTAVVQSDNHQETCTLPVSKKVDDNARPVEL